jgi:hypothetical protein
MNKKKEFNKLSVPNAEQGTFREKLIKIEPGEYEVEQLNNGNKIIIEKPGRKGPDDFRVYLYNPNLNTRKKLTYDEIFSDIELKNKKEPEKTKALINGLNDVCKGKEPDNVIKTRKIENTTSLPVDTLLKSLKWIWGQEDCNYKNGKGRWLSMDEINKKYGNEEKK